MTALVPFAKRLRLYASLSKDTVQLSLSTEEAKELADCLDSVPTLSSIIEAGQARLAAQYVAHERMERRIHWWHEVILCVVLSAAIYVTGVSSMGLF